MNMLRRRMMMGQSGEVNPYAKMYLTFEMMEAGTVSFSTNSIYYSLDDGKTWTALAADVATPTIAAGSKVCFKASGLTPGYSGIGTFSTTANFNAMGNVMSMQDGDDFANSTTLGANYQFSRLFNNNTRLVDAANLVLPATTLANYCYREMFRGCAALTTAPELPATTLANNCYNSMFSGCTSLTVAPALPATTLANYCYASMFYGCTALTTAPELPATTLANYCYSEMFGGCAALTTAPELPATTLATQCYYQMFYDCTALNYIKCLATNISASNSRTRWVSGVASTGTFVKAASMSSWSTGTSGIPSGWTVENA